MQSRESCRKNKRSGRGLWRIAKSKAVCFSKNAKMQQTCITCHLNKCCVKYANTPVFSNLNFPCKDRIFDSILIRENIFQRKYVFSHILRRENTFILTSFIWKTSLFYKYSFSTPFLWFLLLTLSTYLFVRLRRSYLLNYFYYQYHCLLLLLS